ncbi:hypothetical protein [Novosphingobium sp. SG707]|uniref:hypothetical protein n=1 Tax=Novosphingobium sp. SG707 TaxID=2586996 RepID=UPI001B2FEFC5|nr:hypothetical protein [Novosphingobium sp. SG707]
MAIAAAPWAVRSVEAVGGVEQAAIGAAFGFPRARGRHATELDREAPGRGAPGKGAPTAPVALIGAVRLGGRELWGACQSAHAAPRSAASTMASVQSAAPRGEGEGQAMAIRR